MTLELQQVGTASCGCCVHDVYHCYGYKEVKADCTVCQSTTHVPYMYTWYNTVAAFGFDSSLIAMAYDCVCVFWHTADRDKLWQLQFIKCELTTKS